MLHQSLFARLGVHQSIWKQPHEILVVLPEHALLENPGGFDQIVQVVSLRAIDLGQCFGPGV